MKKIIQITLIAGLLLAAPTVWAQTESTVENPNVTAPQNVEVEKTKEEKQNEALQVEEETIAVFNKLNAAKEKLSKNRDKLSKEEITLLEQEIAGAEKRLEELKKDLPGAEVETPTIIEIEEEEELEEIDLEE